MAAATTDEIVEENEQARLAGLRASLAVLAIFGLTGVRFRRGIPTRQPSAAPRLTSILSGEQQTRRSEDGSCSPPENSLANGLGNLRGSGGNKHLDIYLDLPTSLRRRNRARPCSASCVSDRCRQVLQVVASGWSQDDRQSNSHARQGCASLQPFPLGMSWCPIPITSMMLRRCLPTANPDRRVEWCRLHKDADRWAEDSCGPGDLHDDHPDDGADHFTTAGSSCVSGTS